MLTHQVIAAYPFFGELSADSRRLVASHGKLKSLPHGASVIRKGDRVGGMYFVLTGRLRVFAISPDGDEAALYFVGPGESCLLATGALFAEMLYPAWVEVQSRELKLFSVPAATFRRLHDDEPAVRDFTLRVLSHRVFDLMAAVEELSLHSFEDRLTRFLFRHADGERVVELTHQKIAHSLGTAREVVSRKLKHMRAAGLIEVKRGRIQLLQGPRRSNDFNCVVSTERRRD